MEWRNAEVNVMIGYNMRCLTIRGDDVLQGIDVIDDPIVGRCVLLGSAQIYGNMSKIGMFLKNQPDIRDSRIHDAFPVLVTSGSNVFQTLAKPDPAHEANPSIIVRMDTRGRLEYPMICGSAAVEDGHPQLLGLAFKSNFDSGKWSTSEDSLWILKPGDALIYNVEGNLDNWCITNDNGELIFKEGEE